jgi:hypothetical protein
MRQDGVGQPLALSPEWVCCISHDDDDDDVRVKDIGGMVMDKLKTDALGETPIQMSCHPLHIPSPMD